jgi:transposase InsO family protein
MQQRRRMIDDWCSRLYSKKELCERYDVSRPTLDLWIERFKAGGYAGLNDHSHAPRSCPHRTDESIEQLLIETRRQHPHWGPKMIRDRLLLKDPNMKLPAVSTIGAILERAGLIDSKRRSVRPAGVHQKPPAVDAPNQLWNIDFKGEHRLKSGSYVYPLTISDTFSRYMLCCQGHASTHGALVRQQLAMVFREYGLPDRIRSDNGSPFAGNGLWGLSRLNVWWMKLGIIPITTRPATPGDNAIHERLHRTQKAETVFPIAADLEQQQRRFDAFRSDYNHERPHQGIGGVPPARLYRASERRMPETEPEADYAAHMEVRSVTANGTIRFNGTMLFLSEALSGERIALELIDEEVWSIQFFAHELGRLNTQTMQLR